MNRTLTFRLRDLAWFLVINLILLQNALVRVSSVFRYIDEALTVFFFLTILLHFYRLRRDHLRILILLFFLFALGLIGNATSGIARPKVAILLDMLYFSKLFICLIGSILYFEKKGGLDRITRLLAAETHLFTAVGLVLALLSQRVNLGMTYGVRFGFKAFHYIYSNPGMFSQYCMAFLLILTVDLRNARNRFGRYVWIGLLFLLWFTTGRTRGIATVMIWCFVLMITNSGVFKKDNALTTRQKVRKLLKPHYMIPGIIAVLLVGWDQFQHYFGSEATTARVLLLRGSISVMRDYFPWGAGLATFGTEMAAQYYSPLYYRYGLNTYWALAEGGGELTDCFWPAVGAEFGFFGILIMALLVWILSKIMVRQTKADRYGLVAAVTYLLYMYISSTGSSVFTAYATVGFVVMFIGLITRKAE